MGLEFLSRFEETTAARRFIIMQKKKKLVLSCLTSNYFYASEIKTKPEYNVVHRVWKADDENLSSIEKKEIVENL